MAVSIIPVQNIPDQRFNIELDGQDCEIHLYLRYKYMYIDLTVGDEVLFNGQICLNNTDLMQELQKQDKEYLKKIIQQNNEILNILKRKEMKSWKMK